MYFVDILEEFINGLIIGVIATVFICLLTIQIRKPKWGIIEWFGGKFRIERF